MNFTDEIVVRKMGSLQEEHPQLLSTGAPLLLGVSYVASLYVGVQIYQDIKTLTNFCLRFGDPIRTEITLTPSRGDSCLLAS